MFNDIRYAVRFLARKRAFTLVAVITVALGVGANTAIFSIADAVLFRPLPYAHRDRLYALEVLQVATGQRFSTIVASDLRAARDTGVLDAVMDLDPIRAAYVREGDRLQPIRIQPVPATYLDVLGVRPLHGRNFNESDTGQRAVLLTYRTWVGRYGGNQGVVGTSVPAADGPPLQIIGVLPAAFPVASVTAFLAPPDAIMLEATAAGTPAPASRAFTPIVRLGPGTTEAAASARLAAVHGSELDPGKAELRLVPLRDLMGRGSSGTLKLLCAAAFLVLLVGCANLANLVMARGAERERELAVRASLGAPQWRLIRLLLVENLVLAALGGVAGLCLAYWSFDLLVASLPAALARAVNPALDARALAVGVVLAAAAGMASGLLPAWRLARTDARAGLRLGRLQGWSSRAAQKTLLSLEVGVAVVAVIAAVLLGRSLARLVTEQLGFDSMRLIVSARMVSSESATMSRPARAAQFIEQLDAVRALPEVRFSGAMSMLPAAGAAPDFSLFPRGAGKGGVWTVSGGFFRTMGVPLIEGREIDDRESFDGAPVGVLNQSAVRLLFPDGHALGRQVTAPKQPARTVVGVVADWRRSLKEPAVPALYVPFERSQFRTGQMIVDAPDSPALRERIRVAVLRVTPDADVRIEPVSALLDREVAPLRFMLVTIGLFASLTLLLAMLGVYGVVAFIAGERMREYGVRVALGATHRAIGALVVRQAMIPIAVGLSGGTIAAIWTSRLLASELYQVSPADGVTFTTTVLLLFACGLGAASVPARRATRVDPMIALRAE